MTGIEFALIGAWLYSMVLFKDPWKDKLGSVVFTVIITIFLAVVTTTTGTWF